METVTDSTIDAMESGEYNLNVSNVWLSREWMLALIRYIRQLQKEVRELKSKLK